MTRWLLIGLAVALALPALAIGGFLLLFDADSLKPRIAEAVTRTTGRAFAIEGRLTLKPALVPTLSAENLMLANVAGGSAPEMLRLRRAELRLALLPLLSGRAEVASLSLEGGTLLLERDNWRFVRPDAPPDPNARPAPAREPMVLDIRRVSLRDWTVSAGGEPFQIPRATLTGQGPGQPYDVNATVIARGAEALLEGRGTPNGGRVTATLPGARITIEAARQGDDWRGTLAADAPQLAVLSRLAGRELPALTGVAIRASGGWIGGGVQLASLEARAAGGAAMGATLTSAQLTMASADGPAKLEARGRFRDQDIVLTGEATPMALRAGTAAPVALRVQGAGADV
ncbi:MAG TPA: AsmA family protein, partial [Roseococcus sp.]|nr:AsmA family protein [Roseococcus sp.]